MTIIKCAKDPIHTLGYKINRQLNDFVGGTAATALCNIWKDKAITLNTEKKLLTSLVFPISTYAAKCWTMKVSDRTRVTSFELWCYRRVTNKLGRTQNQRMGPSKFQTWYSSSQHN